jgi:hypothetical protein
MEVRQQHFLDIVPINILQTRFTGQFDSVVDDRLLVKLPPSCCMLLAIVSSTISSNILQSLQSTLL